jgi:hypothetical protein
MDLSQFATKDNADAGVWTPVTLYGKPADFDLLILGDDSDAVQQQGRKAMKKLKNIASREKDNLSKEYSDNAVDEMADSGDEAVLARIAGIRGWKVGRKGAKEISRESEPVTMNGTELKNNRDSYKLLISKIPAVKEFVLKVSRDRTNFLSRPSGN